MNTAVSRAIDILFFVSTQEHNATLSNIVRELDIPKSSAYSIIHTLIAQDMLRVYDERRMTLGLGYRAFELGLAYVGNQSLWEIVHKELERLIGVLKITSSYFISNGGKVTLMDLMPFHGSVYPNYSVGSQWPLGELPAGTVCLAAQSDQELSAYLAAEPAKSAERTREIYGARDAGYHLDSTGELASISFPVYGAQKQCIGAVCVYELPSKLHSCRLQEIVRLSKDCAQRISKQSGWGQS